MSKKLPVPLPPGDEYYAGEQWQFDPNAEGSINIGDDTE